MTRSGWSSAEGPGRKIWGGGGSPPPPADCASAMSAATVLAPAEINDYGPFSVTPATPATIPALGLMFWIVSEYTGAVAVPIPTGLWTPVYRSQTTLSDANQIVNSYLAIPGAGTPPPFTADGVATSGGAPWSRGVSVAIPTSAVAPVQTASATATANLVLGVDPTPGNVLVAGMIKDALSSPSFVVPTGYTLLLDTGRWGPGSGWSSMIVYRCVQGGDTKTQNIFGLSGADPHWGTLAEVVIS